MQIVSKNRCKDTAEDFIEGLRHFDKDGSGYISSAELRNLLTALGEKLTEDKVEQLLANQENSKGTIIAAIKLNSGVLLCFDSAAVYKGEMKNDATKSLICCDNKPYLASISAGDGVFEIVSDNLRNYNSNKKNEPIEHLVDLILKDEKYKEKAKEKIKYSIFVTNGSLILEISDKFEGKKSLGKIVNVRGEKVDQIAGRDIIKSIDEKTDKIVCAERIRNEMLGVIKGQIEIIKNFTGPAEKRPVQNVSEPLHFVFINELDTAQPKYERINIDAAQ